jgi:2-polyprenyl-3-methyl-5-hydroxy-6-metoxy-1,4-benzoquinol methylase
MSATVQDTPEILGQRAEAALARGDIEDAFALYIRAVNAAPNVHLYKERLLEIARRGVDVVHSDALEGAVAACLKTPDLAGAVENWVGLLMANPRFQAAYGLASRRPFDGSSAPTITDIEPLLGPLLLEGLKSNVVCDPVFEEFVTAVRRHVLEEFSKDGRFPREGYMVLASALSHYALLSDFILEETEREQGLIAELRHRIESGIAIGADSVAVLACYRPLHALTNADELLQTFKEATMVSEIVRAQIADPVAVHELAVSIPALTPVADKTSLRVREQYEIFPYPRWKTLSRRDVVENWRAEEFSRKLEAPLLDIQARILIAGCGTGRDAAIHSMRFPRSSITAVDISRTSLGYAAAKAQELGLENLAFVQGDILELGRIGGEFDHICCTGVLHHLEDPRAGWRVLSDLLKPGALMRVGLYSRAGRKAVAAAQDAARLGNYAPTREGVLRFRRDCRRICDRETLLGLWRLQDYYHTAMYRDLLFPAREHRFDLIEIGDMLDKLGLSFEGFYISADVLSKYRLMFRDDRNATDLQSWRQFESRFPDTFASMYIFWCRKRRH